MSSGSQSSYHTIESPRSTPGAIAMIRVVHPDPSSLGLIDPAPGAIRLGSFFGIDEGVIVRMDADSILLMPHGGLAIVRAISAELSKRGVAHSALQNPAELFPEAENEIDAWMLWALSIAASPDAIDELLDQPRRWGDLGVKTIADANRIEEVADSRVLTRLITPAIVAAVGRANIGKSTLINALSGHQVAIVADVAGTTRDHVGVLVDLGGLVVRWIDTPGIDDRIGDGDEIDIAMRVVAQADLIVHCIDPSDQTGELDERLVRAIGQEIPLIRVGTRADLGSHEAHVDVAISIGSGGVSSGVETLVGSLREALVPSHALSSGLPWRFWEGLNADLG